MLTDRDRIFTNLNGRRGADLQSALKRGAWDGTKFLLEKGKDWIVDEMKSSGYSWLGTRLGWPLRAVRPVTASAFRYQVPG